MLKFIKSKKGFKSYQADKFKIYYGEKGSVAGDNEINPKEKIYLVKGKLKVTVKSKTMEKNAPFEFKIPKNTYYKAVAIKEVIFLVFK